MRHRAHLVGVALSLAVVTACSSSDGATSADDGGAQAVTVTSCGQKLSFGEAPERAVTLDQSSTETLLELGLGDRMAGTSNLKTEIPAEYRDAYDEIPVLSPKTLTGERLRAATPDMVVSSFSDLFTKDQVGTRAELAELEVPSYISAVDCPDENDTGKAPFDLLFDDYANLGKVFGVEERAERLVEEQRAAVRQAARTAGETGADRGKPTVVWVYSVYKGMPYVAGGSALPSEMSRLVGARNAFDEVDEDWPEVSWEAIAEKDPDVVVIGDIPERGAAGDSAEDKRKMMREDPLVSKLTAVRKNRIIEVPGVEMDPSVRSVHTLGLVAEGLKDLGYAR